MVSSLVGTRPWVAVPGHPIAALRRPGIIPLRPPGLPRHRGCLAARSSGVSTATGSPPTLRDICQGRVPEHILKRAEDIGFTLPTEVQRQSLPVLLSGKDCVLQAQTGSGKTLAYMLLIFSVINFQRSAVQALIVVPTRELGMQVARVARMLAAKLTGFETVKSTCAIMALLDGGMLKRHKSWLKAEPPEIVVATIGSLCQMLEKHVLKLEAIQVLVVDEVDFMFNSSKQVQSLRKLLTSYSTIDARQTIFASASIPQHNRFLYDCVQQKWTKKDVVHVHVNAVEPLPSCLSHRYVICRKHERLGSLLFLLQSDTPKSGIIFVNDQSEKSKRTGDLPSTLLVLEFLKACFNESLEIHLLEEDMNYNARATSLSEVRQGSCILVATDIAGRGVDLPETTHIYNFDLPKTAVDYLHRAGRAGRRPFSDDTCVVTSLISPEERFVLQRFENELMFNCEELQMMSLQ
uniref:RNA helicase n=1 Tax=Anthurium amnicola TaxID=1678845 RepID=A0A1D1YN51_9ARAE